MRPLMEILEDERDLQLKLDTIYQNMLRYPDQNAYDMLDAKRIVVKRDLDKVYNELREYIVDLFNGVEIDSEIPY